MSSINNLASSAYYQLSNSSTGLGGSSTTATDPLLQALSSTPDSPATSSSSAAYELNLSPEAQQYLSSLGAGSTASTGSAGGSSNFTLSTQQQQAITTILEKYKDAPQTQATFDQIQNDLSAAGLSPSQLSQQDQAKNFNPTALLVDDLNGDYTDANAMASGNSSTEQTKSSNYMQQIISQWKDLAGSSASGSASASASGVTATSGTGGA